MSWRSGYRTDEPVRKTLLRCYTPRTKIGLPRGLSSLGFHASPDLIRQLGGILDQQEQHSEVASSYANDNLGISDNADGLIAEFLTAHETVQSQIKTALQQLTAVCKEDALSLKEAAKYYETTEEAEAQRVDNAYPGKDAPTVPKFIGPFILRETMVPEGRLSQPKEPDEFQDPMTVVNTLSSFFSPGYWTQEVLDVLLHVRPADEVSTWIAGDWTAFAKCGSAFNSLGFFCSDIGVNIRDNHQLLLRAWSGKAANASFEYFQRLSASLEEHKKAFEKLRDNYHNVALAVWEFSKVAGDLVQIIYDEVFWIVAELVAGGIMAETVIAPAILWSVAAWQCVQIVRAWGKVGDLFDAVKLITRTAHAEILAVMSDQGGFKAHPLPGSYQHPAVK
jgi:uncharacterized protein YukE